MGGRAARRLCGPGVHPGLGHRLSPRVQLTTDGHKVYLEAVEGAKRGLRV